MNSVERVKATLKFEETDKVPLGHYVIDCDIAAKVLGRKTFIRDKAGVQIAYWEGRRDEVVESLIRDIPELFQQLDIYDIISIRKIALVPPKGYQPEAPKKIGEEVWEDKAGCIYKYSDVTNESHCVHDPHLATPRVPSSPRPLSGVSSCQRSSSMWRVSTPTTLTSSSIAVAITG